MQGMYLELKEFLERERLDRKKILNDLNDGLQKLKHTFPSASNCYEIIEKLNWTQSNEREFHSWQKKALSLFSLCKLYENSIHFKLPKLQEISKGITYEIISNSNNTNRQHLKRK